MTDGYPPVPPGPTQPGGPQYSPVPGSPAAGGFASPPQQASPPPPIGFEPPGQPVPTGFGPPPQNPAGPAGTLGEIDVATRLGGLGIALGLTFAIWGLLTVGGEGSIVDTETQFPTIRATFKALGELVDSGGVGGGESLANTIVDTGGRFLAALIGGLTLGGVLGQAGHNAWTRSVLDPLASFFRMIAPAVLLGLVILWRGVGDESIILVGALCTTWVVAGRTADALARSNRPGAGSMQTRNTDGLRLATLVAWWATLTAETFIGRDGLASGALLSTRFLRIDQTVAYIIVIGAVGFVIDTAARAIGYVIRDSG